MRYSVCETNNSSLEAVISEYASAGWALHTAQFIGEKWTLIFQRPVE